MTAAFYITYWIIVLILLAITITYTLFAYDSLGQIQDLNENPRYLVARDYLLWSLILFIIAIVFLVIFVLYSFVFGWIETYSKVGFVFILYAFFFVWMLVGVILLGAAIQQVGGSSNTLQEIKAEMAVRDITIALISSVTSLLLLIGGYLGYVYRYERQRMYCKHLAAARMLRT